MHFNRFTLREPTRPSLDALHFLEIELSAANAELIDILDAGGSVSRIWDTPRRYLRPEGPTPVPFLKQELIDRVYDACFTFEPESPDPDAPTAWDKLSVEVLMRYQFHEVLRREYLPERLDP